MTTTPARLTFTQKGCEYGVGILALGGDGHVRLLIGLLGGGVSAIGYGVPTVHGVTLSDDGADGVLDRYGAVLQPLLHDLPTLRRHLAHTRGGASSLPAWVARHADHLEYAYSLDDYHARAAATALLASGFTGTVAELAAASTGAGAAACH